MPYVTPTDTDSAFAYLAAAQPKIVAGGTDVFPALAPGETYDEILDVTRIPGMRGIAATEDGWRIGAATTWTDIVKSDLPAAFDGLKRAAREVGSIQIQNRGTIAGNLCNASPAADGAPPLLTLNAKVEIASTRGQRTLPLNLFITGVRRTALEPGEMVTAILIPGLSSAAASSFLKLGSRKYLVISIAMVAAVVIVETGAIAQARLAVGSCSAVAQRLPALEQDLVGLPVSQLPNFAFAAERHFMPLSPITDVRGSAEYRAEAAIEICRRALIGACEESRPHG